MSEPEDIPEARVQGVLAELKRDAEASGYHLNPDRSFLESLVRGLAVNEERYGFRACPCRLASGDREDDLDIICPCYYRDADVTDHGACYCALYVSEDVAKGRRELRPVPERRPAEEERRKELRAQAPKGGGLGGALEYPVWRCAVCGYLAARDAPPDVCPICKAKSDRFTRFA
jgi:ferredoxin-thioredoxin reductase catalytic chain